MNTSDRFNTSLMISALRNAHDAVSWEDDGECACGMSDAARMLGALAACAPLPARGICGNG